MFDSPEIHYLLPVPQDRPEAREVIRASRSLSCFGWGIDMAYADAQLLDEPRIAMLKGTRWFPKPGTMRDEGLLRVPVKGTVADLRRAHQSALNRIEHGKPLRMIDKPRVFDQVFYAGTERTLGRPCAAFALRTSEGEFFTYPHAQLIHIAGMTRCAAIKVMKAYPPDDLENDKRAAWVENHVAGHRATDSEDHKQFSYIPLPSVGHEHADALIRRVMVIAPFGDYAHLRHLADQLDVAQLTPEGGGEGPLLERLRLDGVMRHYLGWSTACASVTPIILPGHDDPKHPKTEKLIQKALLQSGIDQPYRFSCGSVPNFKNFLSVNSYNRVNRPIAHFPPNLLV